jgi:protein TonB
LKEFYQKLSQNRFSLAVVFSLLLHIILWNYTDLFHSSHFEEESTPEPIEITQVPPEIPSQQAPPQKPASKKELQVAETEDAKNRKIDPNAKVLSENNQTAEKDTRAKMVDDFRNKQGTGLKNDNKVAQDNPLTGETENNTAITTDDISEAIAPKSNKQKGIKRDWKKLSLKDLSVGGEGGPEAASDDNLKNVDTGDRTILSTREFRFFSYYHRIKELLRQYWKPNVERKLYKLYEKGKNVGEEEMVTRLLVLLDGSGKIEKISRVLSSGISELDEAAIEAFNRAGPFPNPPKGMVDSDGFVRINWEFILKTEAVPRIQFSSAGGGAGDFRSPP